MPDITNFHNQAMGKAEQALFARRSGDYGKTQALFRDAYEIERRAAELVQEDEEPSRGVLYRSAASLALSGGLHREAERMVAAGLLGHPPEQIVEELRDLLQQIHFERHLKLRGVILGEDEVQLSIAGPDVGHGIVRSDEFIRRIGLLEKLSYRTAERKLGKEFRERGNVSKFIRETCEPYLSPPRAASFAVTIRFGVEAKNLQLFEDIPTRSIVDDVIDGLDLVNRKHEDLLRDRIKDERYFNNFVALAKKLSPDAANVRVVGFTTVRDKIERTVALTRPSSEIRVPASAPEVAEEGGQRIEVIGVLDFASAKETEIHLTDQQGDAYVVVVPRGVLADVVRPYWEETVKITGTRVKNKIHFEDIEKA